MIKMLSLAAALMLTAPVLAHDAATQPAPVGLGQTFRVNQLRFTPIELIEDSRCPMNARCIWAGTVRVKARIRDGSKMLVQELELGKPFLIRGRSLTLSDVTPPRVAGGPQRKPRYRFAFTFDQPLR